MNVWWLVFIAVAIVLVGILYLRLHAFLALIAAGLVVACLTSDTSLRQYADMTTAQKDKLGPSDNLSASDLEKRVKAKEKLSQQLIQTGPIRRLTNAFGNTAGKIGLVIAFASIIGICLLESGAAQAIIDRMLAFSGPRRAPEALALGSFVLGVPVFFDTVFYLMVPLARSLRRRLGGDYVLFILAILAGGSLAHSLVPPTPGPLQVTERLGVSIGTMMVAGGCVCLCSSFVSLAAARLINRFTVVPLRTPQADDTNSEMEDDDGDGDSASDEFQNDSDATTNTRSTRHPPLLLALVPIVLPVFLIGGLNGLDVFTNLLETSASETSDGHWHATLVWWLRFVGDKNVALGISAILSLGLLRYVSTAATATQRRTDTATQRRIDIVQRALASGGVIILITASGGAFGEMLRHAGIGSAIQDLAVGAPGIMLLPIAFLVTTAIRTLQGSSTVAMITAAGVLQGFGDLELPYATVYLALAIGAGSKPVAWMTDSGFWVICKMSGMTESEGLRTVSPMSTAMGLSALFFTIVGALLFPLV